ncbi:FAD-dependent monooxygenase [Blastococcus montanus]|uniref:FAD-dependent monooxygenase n=1 Tax=Blastococcus montanus TaxID=3144973 RepID=UPI0032092CDC
MRGPLEGCCILVSGASIAGPALAYWLHRSGARVTVVEKAPELRPGGQLVDLRGVGRSVVARMGLDERVRAAAEANYGLSFVDGRNRPRGTLRAEDFGGDGPIAEIEILRGELSRVIHEATAADVDYLFGDHIAALEDRSDGVDVTFASGDVRTFDLVVGADGAHSETRRLAMGEDAAHLAHLDTYLAFWTAQNHLGIEDWTYIYSEPGRTMGMRAILDNSRVMAFLSFRGGPPAYDHRDVATQKRIVHARAAGMGWECAQLLAQVDTAPDFWFDSCAQVRLDSWSRGRVALVGDAAYCSSPLTGHGATIALVGAYVLAGELAAGPDDHRAAFERYEERLRRWLVDVHGLAAGQGQMMTPESGSGIALRNNLVRLARYVPGKSLLMRSQMRISNGFELPDYSVSTVPAG